MGTAIVWVALIVLASGIPIYFWVFPKWRRRHQLEKLSTYLGLVPEPSVSVLDESRLLDAPLFKRDRARCSNLLRGEVRGAEAYVFDYSTSDGGRWHVPDSVVFFRLRQGRLPEFELRPRAASEARGLELGSNPRFCEIYALTGDDEKSIREVFEGDVLDFFERGENQSWALASNGSWLATAFWPFGERKKVLHPKEVMGFVEDAKEVLFMLSAS
jgi:hypothetical protein